MNTESLVIAAVILTAGAGLIASAWRLRLRHHIPCLEDYALYILFFYLMTFANQVLPTAAWGTTWYERGVLDPTFWILQVFLGLPPALAAVFFFVRFIFGLSERTPGRKFGLIFPMGSAAFVAVVAVYIFVFFRMERVRETVLVFDGIRFLVMLSLLAIPAIAAFRSFKIPEAGKIRMLRQFALVQAVSLIAFEAAVIAHPPELIHDILRSLFNIPPFLFLALRISTLVPAAFTGDGFDAGAESLLAGRGVSPREREIIQLVCKGRTNKEIEEALFISLDTVKRHMTHIFRKLGVRNRAELVALVLKRDENPSSVGNDRMDRDPAAEDRPRRRG